MYEDPSDVPMKNEAIGYEPSFENDPNISMDERRNQDIPGDIKTESNPFANRGSYNNQGNTLNEPVPFLGESPNNNSASVPVRSNANYSGYSNPNSSYLLIQDQT